MRNRFVCVAVLLAASLGGNARPAAAADWYDVLEALSGPGPFRHDRIAHFLVTLCPDKWTILGRSQRVGKQLPCGYIDTMHYRTKGEQESTRFGEVEAELTDVGVTFELKRFFEYGFGFGRIKFDSTTPQGGRVPGFDRFIFTPVRVVIKPLLAVPKLQDQEWAAVVKLYLRETRIAGRLNGANFGVADDVFNANGDYVTSAGFMIDLSEPIGWAIRKAMR